jgi:hypothetical protein
VRRVLPVLIVLAGCASSAAPEPVSRMLTAAEYNATVRDLLGYGVEEPWPSLPGADAEDAPWPYAFPDEPGVDGYAGFADGQAVSPALVEAQADAAARYAGFVADSPYFSVCGDDSCARDSLLRFAARAWRRPLTADEADALGAFFDDSVAEWGPDGAVALAAQGLLQSPQFLYLLEDAELTPWQRAARLSYFLWDSMPDPELFAAAAEGRLETGAELEQQARRLLADRRARQAVVEFHRQWAQVDAVYGANPSVDVYGPRYAAELLGSANPELLQEFENFWAGFVVGTRRAMDEEARLFFERVIFDRGGTLADLLTDTQGYVTQVGIFGRSSWDANTADLYGAEDGVDGPSYVFLYEDLSLPYDLFLNPAQLPADQRAGVLTLGAVLAGRAHPVHASPVQRGLFVLERLACLDQGQPPAAALDAAEPDAPDLDGTVRSRLEAITSAPECISCHDGINAAGFAFGHYDSLAGWQDDEDGAPIDATGTLRLGDEALTFDGAVDLAHQLADSRVVHDCYARTWFRYALGRIERGAAAEELGALQAGWSGDVQELLVAIAASDAFGGRR